MRALVSVVMAVYNGEKYLREAVESILTQTFGDFEFIIVNDGSTDGTSRILEHYQRIDSRIRVIHNPKNEGEAAALNKGCDLARSKYIARMDADDVSLPERFDRQVRLLEVHPEVGVLGTWTECIDHQGTVIDTYRFPTSPTLVGWSLLFYDCIVHPTVMMRRNLFKELGGYRQSADPAEDYELWGRAIFVTKIVNLPHILLQYRLHKDSVSVRYFHTQENVCFKVVCSMMARLLGFEVSTEMAASLSHIAQRSPLDRLQIEPVAVLIEHLYKAYVHVNRPSRSEAKGLALDARGKLFDLALSVSQFSLLDSFRILTHMLAIFPPYLPISPISTRTVTSGLSTFLNIWMKRKR